MQVVMTSGETYPLGITDLFSDSLQDKLAGPDNPALRARQEKLITILGLLAGQLNENTLIDGMVSAVTSRDHNKLDDVREDIRQLSGLLGKYGTAMLVEMEDCQPRETHDTAPLRLHASALTFLRDYGVVRSNIVSLNDTELESVVTALARTLAPLQPRLAARGGIIESRLRNKLTTWNDSLLAKREGVTPVAIHNWWKRSCDIFKRVRPSLMEIGTGQQDGPHRTRYTLPSPPEGEAARYTTPYEQVAEKWTVALRLGVEQRTMLAEYLNSQSGHIMTRGKRSLIVQARALLLQHRGVQHMLREMDEHQRELTLRIIATEMKGDRFTMHQPTTLRPIFQKEAGGHQVTVSEIEEIALGGIYSLFDSISNL